MRGWRKSLVFILGSGLLGGGLMAVVAGVGGNEGRGDRSLGPLTPDTPGVIKVVAAIRDRSPAALYSSLAEETRREIPRASFNKRYGRGAFGAVEDVAVVGPVRRAGRGIASLRMKLSYQGGNVRRYRGYFVREGRDWRLWFTERER